METEELFQTTIELCELVYDPDTSLVKGYYFLKGYDEFPILFYSSGSTLYVTFRGTSNDMSSLSAVGNSISNIITDIGTTDPLGYANFVDYYDVWKKTIDSRYSKLKAHEGFLRALSRMYTAVYDEIEKYKGRVGSIIISGHSAGGALSALFYYLYQNDTRMDKQTLPIKHVVTYGSPRFLYNFPHNVDLYKESCPNLIRVFNITDIVPYLPFNKPLLFNDNITTGFTHVGKAFCLDSNIDFNSLNALSINVIRKARKSLLEILPTDDLRRNTEFIHSDKFLNLLSNGMFLSFSQFYTEEETDEEKVVAYTKDLMEKCNELKSYGDKCDLLAPMSLTDLLKKSPIGETNEQENLTIAGVGGALLGFNKITIEAHSFPKYNENLNHLISKQRVERDTLEQVLADDVDLIEQENYYNTSLVPVTPSTILDRLFNEIEGDILSGKIVGLIENDEVKSGSIIIYPLDNDGDDKNL